MRAVVCEFHLLRFTGPIDLQLYADASGFLNSFRVDAVARRDGRVVASAKGNEPGDGKAERTDSSQLRPLESGQSSAQLRSDEALPSSKYEWYFGS